MDFAAETDAILVGLKQRDYASTVRLVNELQERFEAANASGQRQRDIRVSCADLRFDAALQTAQPFEECERRYRELVTLEVDERTELLKSVIFARAVSSDRAEVIQRYVIPAVARAAGKGVPAQLLEEARRLIGTIA